MSPRGQLVAFFALPLAACASRGTKKAGVDLEAARKAVSSAREAGAPEKAPDAYRRAETHLGAAEQAASTADNERASCLSQLTVSEAECALRLSSTHDEIERLPEVEKTAAEADRLGGQLKKEQDDRRRLEERVALLTRELDLTENEVIRTKAKLKGLETKAEATSAMAEARILLRRFADQKGRSAKLTRSQELLDRADQQVQEENYGAALFFVSKALELIEEARRGAAASEIEERPAPKKEYRVVVLSANIRRAPNREAAVVGRAPRDAVLEASVLRGEWVKIAHGALTGWVHRTLLE